MRDYFYRKKVFRKVTQQETIACDVDREVASVGEWGGTQLPEVETAQEGDRGFRQDHICWIHRRTDEFSEVSREGTDAIHHVACSSRQAVENRPIRSPTGSTGTFYIRRRRVIAEVIRLGVIEGERAREGEDGVGIAEAIDTVEDFVFGQDLSSVLLYVDDFENDRVGRGGEDSGEAASTDARRVRWLQGVRRKTRHDGSVRDHGDVYIVTRASK